METENIKGDIKYDKLILLLEVDNVKLMTNNNPIINIKRNPPKICLLEYNIISIVI